MDFDEKHWVEIIKRPDWYVEFKEFATRTKLKETSDDRAQEEKNKKFRYQVRHFFEEQLEKGNVSLGQSGPVFDRERQKPDTIVIHHTSNKPGYRLSYLNAVHLLNIYVPVFAAEKYKGEPIWSGHFMKGKQVFWGYHWLMRMDGGFERLLPDNQIGWHAGNWPINCRSIGICLDNDYEDMCPSPDTLKTLASHIKKYYPQIRPKDIIGHCEAREGTICPGTHFLNEWKPKLSEFFE